MSAGLPLQPQFIPASAEIGHLSGCKRLIVRLLIHIGDHQHLQRPVILHDDRYHAVIVLLEISPCKCRVQRFHGHTVFTAEPLQGKNLPVIIIDGIPGNAADLLVRENFHQLIQCNLIDLHIKGKLCDSFCLTKLVGIHEHQC